MRRSCRRRTPPPAWRSGSKTTGSAPWSAGQAASFRSAAAPYLALHAHAPAGPRPRTQLPSCMLLDPHARVLAAALDMCWPYRAHYPLDGPAAALHARQPQPYKCPPSKELPAADSRRLLARRCCSDALGVPWRQVAIARTRGRKPYCANAEANRRHAPNFNFNISHEVSRRAESRRACAALYLICRCAAALTQRRGEQRARLAQP